MAEEAKATQEQANQGGVQQNPSDLGAEIIADENKTSDSDTHDFGGLFSDEGERPSESDLKGEQPAPKQEDQKPSGVKDESKKGESTATPKPEGDKKPDEKAKEEKKEEKPKEEEAKKKEEKPPEGFVRKEALAETRTKLKDANARIADLQAQLAAKPTVQPQQTVNDSKWKDFKVLSDEQYDQLVEDDPIEAQKYSHKLRQYERYQDTKARAEQEAVQSKARVQSLVDQAVTKIKEAVPGIYDEDSDVRSQLAEFASEHGFDDDAYLDAMTNPATLIVPPGQDKSFLLGPGAASLIKLINNLRAKVNTASDPAKLKDEITKEIEPKLREQITQELVAKFKGAGKEPFKSLTSVPGSGDKPESTGPMTEAQWAKLSPEEREKLLQEGY